MSYGKFFSSTFTGSMAGSGAHVFAVWGYCIANGAGGQVDLNPIVVSAVIGCTQEEVARAIEFLSSPDPNSRSKEHDGRRLLHLTGVVHEIVNHSVYRALATQESVREYHRDKKRDQRVRDSVPDVLDIRASASVSPSASGSDLVLAPKSKRSANPKTGIPEDFAPNARHQTIATEQGVDLALEFQKFVDNCSKRAARYANWDAALREWLRNAKRFGGASAAQQTLRYKFKADWKPSKAHRAKGFELGLTDTEILARVDDCLLKPIKSGFLDEDEHFFRELVWAKRDKDAEKARRETYANRKDFETPGHARVR